MKELSQPWQFLLSVLAGWVNRQQQDVIEYLLVENRVLRQKLGRRRIPLNDEQRRCLAIKGKVLGRKVLEQVAGIITPETILRYTDPHQTGDVHAGNQQHEAAGTEQHRQGGADFPDQHLVKRLNPESLVSVGVRVLFDQARRDLCC